MSEFVEKVDFSVNYLYNLYRLLKFITFASERLDLK